MPIGQGDLDTIDPAKLRSIATIIAHSDTPPESLIKSFPQAVSSLAWKIKITREYPTRMELKARLGKFYDSSENILGELDRGLLREIFQDDGRKGQQVLKVFEERLRKLSTKVLYARIDIPDGSGKHKHFLCDHDDPVTYCAELICAAWHKHRKKLPPHTKEEVWKACQELWEMTGAKARSSSSGQAGTLTGWRAPLSHAKHRLKDIERLKKLKNLFEPDSQKQGFLKYMEALKEMIWRVHTKENRGLTEVKWSGSLFSYNYGRLGRITILDYELTLPPMCPRL